MGLWEAVQLKVGDGGLRGVTVGVVLAVGVGENLGGVRVAVGPSVGVFVGNGRVPTRRII